MDMIENNFSRIFKIKKPIIGMIHLAGTNHKERVKQALEELTLFQEEGVDGAIIEDYHGNLNDVDETLRQSSLIKLKVVRGVNILRYPYIAFEMADKYGAKFIQFDSVQTHDLDLERYNRLRKQFPNIAVLGGIGFKYTRATGNPVIQDLEEGKSRCDAIVTTGSGTGIETPLEKLQTYKRLLPDFPLIVGAGVNINNIYKQLMITDGAIIGSYLKNGNTQLPIEAKRVKEIMNVAREIREKN